LTHILKEIANGTSNRDKRQIEVLGRKNVTFFSIEIHQETIFGGREGEKDGKCCVTLVAKSIILSQHQQENQKKYCRRFTDIYGWGD
jgi:hypothetical protein